MRLAYNFTVQTNFYENMKPIRAPNSYKTSTSGLPFYNPPSPKPSYNVPKENTPNGFLVEYHPFKDASNAIEEPNLCKFYLMSFPSEVLRDMDFYL